MHFGFYICICSIIRKLASATPASCLHKNNACVREMLTDPLPWNISPLICFTISRQGNFYMLEEKYISTVINCFCQKWKIITEQIITN